MLAEYQKAIADVDSALEKVGEVAGGPREYLEALEEIDAKLEAYIDAAKDDVQRAAARGE